MNLPRQNFRRAFTLIEVMIAITIFFMAMFAILGLLSSGIRSALLLRRGGPTAGMIAAQLTLTNKLEEGADSGSFDAPYSDYHWNSQTEEVATNGLFRVDYTVINPAGTEDSHLSVLFFKPDSGNANNRVGTRRF